jgi:general stress protein 26
MSESKIPEAIVRFLEEADFVSVATSSEEGQPSAANKFLLKVDGDFLYIIDFTKGKTWKNLKHNSFISLPVMDKDNLRDYQINGTAIVLEEGGEYRALMDEFADKQVRFATDRIIHGVRRIKPHSSFAFPFGKKALVLKVKVDDIVEIGPTAELLRDQGPFADGDRESFGPGAFLEEGGV